MTGPTEPTSSGDSKHAKYCDCTDPAHIEMFTLLDEVESGKRAYKPPTSSGSGELLYEKVEKLFDLRVNNTGNEIHIGFRAKGVWVDYEDFMKLRQSIEALITAEKRGAEQYGRLHEIIEAFQNGAVTANYYSERHDKITAHLRAEDTEGK